MPSHAVALEVAVPDSHVGALALLAADDGVEAVGVGDALVAQHPLHQRWADALSCGQFLFIKYSFFIILFFHIKYVNYNKKHEESYYSETY